MRSPPSPPGGGAARLEASAWLSSLTHFPTILVLFRIKDLEDRLHSVQLTRQKEEETFRRK